MKHYTKLFFAAAVAALGLASCAKEVAPVETPKDNLVTVHFGATAGIEGATKATLTPDEQETLFTSTWENGDVLSVEYISPETADNKIITATWTGTSFEAIGLPNETGAWDYTACYPVPDSKDSHIDFGANRTQNGNSYNSIYDVMIGNKSTKNSAAGKDDDGSDIVFNMDRKTAVVYFHLTGGPADEDLVSATLSVEDGFIASQYAYISNFAFAPTEDLKEITITFPEKAPKASDFQLWFNVLPTAYTSMSLEVKTANHTLTLNKNKGGNFVAGKLYKIHKDNVTWTENKNVTFFYESFDSCDGTGGNDGQWSGSIASNTLSKENLDNPSWVFENEKSANKCAKLGAGDKAGKATTPALGINTSTATLSFKAGAWDGKNENTTIIVTANNGGTVEPSTITLKKGEWTDYTCTISGATETTTLTFIASQASKNRFFLDEVMVYSGNKPVVKHTQQISFSKTSVECYIINDTFTEPILSGNKTTVTYSSSDKKVATVDAASGKVTILSAGKTEITATAEESEEYKTATAKYTLTVNKQTQNLSFEKGTYSVLLADKDSFVSVSPVVNGAKTPVSYSITLGEGVAKDAITIDPTTGKVTINAVGTATITATAAETEEYKAASANYVLTVTEKIPTGPTTVVKKISEISGTTNNGTKVSSMKMDDVITLSASTDGNNGKVYNNGAAWKLYQFDNGTMTVTSKAGYVIESITVTFTVSKTGALLYNKTAVTSGKAVAVSGSSVKFTLGNTSTAKNGQIIITAISVTYKQQ